MAIVHLLNTDQCYAPISVSFGVNFACLISNFVSVIFLSLGFNSHTYGSKKNKFEKNLFPYCEKGYHLEEHCMRKQLDEMSTLLKKHTIAPPREKNPDEETLK